MIAVRRLLTVSVYNNKLGNVLYNRIMASRSLCTVAVCQMTSTGDREANFSVCEDMIRNAKASNASMVFLPEGCDYIASSHADTLALAENEDGPFLNRYKNVAKVSGRSFLVGR